MKHSFFQAAVVSILLYGCTIWTLTKRIEEKLDGNYTRMLRAILNRSWRQHPTKHQLYSPYFPSVSKLDEPDMQDTAGEAETNSKVIYSHGPPIYGRAKAGRLTTTYILQLCEDTGCSPEELPEAMNDREKWRERARDIGAGGTTWWWWYHNLFLPMRGQLKKFVLGRCTHLSRSTISLNSEYSFSYTGCHSKVKEPSVTNYLHVVWERTIVFKSSKWY